MRLSSLLLLVLIACGQREPRQPPREQPPAETPARTPEKTPDPDPLADLDRPPDPSEIAPVPPASLPSDPTLRAATPEHGCVLIEETAQRVWPRFGPSTVIATRDRFFVAGYATEDDVETLFVVSATPGSLPTPVRTHTIMPRLAIPRAAPPGLLAQGETSLAIAFADGEGKVRLGTILLSAATSEIASREIVASGADIRFAPSLAAIDTGLLVAYTDATGRGMRAKVVVASQDAATTLDVTPAAMGGASPTFASGTRRPELYFVDARAGVSPLVRVTFDGATPAPGTVARPLGSVAEPVVTRVVRTPIGSFAGYTAIGSAATSAIGIVSLDSPDATARPLVRGTGYGVLQLAATAAPAAALFALDSPLAAPPESPREVHLRVVDEAGEGPPLLIHGPDGHARSPGIARRADGVVAVSFATAGGVYVAFARCDDQ